MTTNLIAHDFAADPDLYNRVVVIGRTEWECMGYSRTGNTIRFARLVETDDHHLRQINIYVDPFKIVRLAEE